jgi:hypothetical protein
MIHEVAEWAAALAGSEAEDQAKAAAEVETDPAQVLAAVEDPGQDFLRTCAVMTWDQQHTKIWDWQSLGDALAYSLTVTRTHRQEDSPGAGPGLLRLVYKPREGIMPNHKQRRKKAGRNKSKKVRAMRLSLEARRGEHQGTSQRGRFRKGLADQPDRQAFKPGSANDFYSRKAA